MSSKFIHLSESPSFLRLNNILCMDGSHFFAHSFADGRLGCFHLLAIVSNAAVKKRSPQEEEEEVEMARSHPGPGSSVQLFNSCIIGRN